MIEEEYEDELAANLEADDKEDADLNEEHNWEEFGVPT